MAIERTILHDALEAASSSSIDAGLHAETSQSISSMNEQWAQTYVGFAINDCLRREYTNCDDRFFVTFETCVDWLEGFRSLDRGKGRIPGALKKRQRFDLIIWSKGSHVRGLVEIKDRRNMHGAARTSDPVRICAALKRWKAIKWGIFLFSVRATRRERERDGDIGDVLRCRYESIVDAIKEACPGKVWDWDLNDDALCKRGGCLIWGGVLFKRAASSN